jgi:hypothetical protein
MSISPVGGVPKTIQAVEKVVVGPVGGPKEAPNKAKTLRKRRFQPLKTGGGREREGVFQHAGSFSETRLDLIAYETIGYYLFLCP